MKTKVFRVRPLARAILKRPVADAIIVLQACIYKSVKQALSLKSILAPRVVKFNLSMRVFTLKYQVSSVEKHDNFEVDNTCGHKWFLKIGLLLLTCKCRPVKRL